MLLVRKLQMGKNECPLDQFLESQRLKCSVNRRCLKFLKQAYTAGTPGMITRPEQILLQTMGVSTIMGSRSGDANYCFMATNLWKRKTTKVSQVNSALWRRHSREDLKLAGLLLSNLSKEELGEDPWMALINLFGSQEPMEIILEIAEEMSRSGHPVPDDEWLIAMAQQSPLWHQVAMLFFSVRGKDIEQLRDVNVSARAVENCLNESEINSTTG